MQYSGAISDYTFHRYIFDATHSHTIWQDADSKVVLYYSLNFDCFNVSYSLDDKALDRVSQNRRRPDKGL
jgi:6-phosphogluconolactonase (cycloisomerase 2 family)